MKHEIKIKNRWNGSVIFEAEVECSVDASKGFKLGLAAKLAIEKKVSLRNAVLRNADLRNADLRNADLRNADLRNADLSGADLSGADLSRADLSDADLIDAVLSGAVLSGADLRGAVLSDDDLRAFKADLWMTLTENRHEAAGVAAALLEGRVDGSTYQGECACLVGTIANIKNVDALLLDHGSDRPAERWFAMIKKGDKPGADTGGEFAARLALEWTEEWLLLNDIASNAEAA